MSQEPDFEEKRTGMVEDDDDAEMAAYWDGVLRHIETHHTGVFMIEVDLLDYEIYYCYAQTRREARTKFLTVYPFYVDAILDISPTQLDPYQIVKNPKFVGEDRYFAAKQKREQERAARDVQRRAKTRKRSEIASSPHMQGRDASPIDDPIHT